jgi:ferredoxin like protein
VSGSSTALRSLDERLALDRYVIDSEHSHIQVDPVRCARCPARPCLAACPASVYRWVDEHMAIRYENCLECGTCQLVCHEAGNGGVDWRNPQGGYGIVLRYG